MSGFTNWIRTTIGDEIFGGVSASVPSFSALWVNLLTALPVSDGNGTSGSPSFSLGEYTEWAPERKIIWGFNFTSQTPRWSTEIIETTAVRWENLQEIGWNTAEVSSIGVATDIIGVGLFSGLSTDSLIAWGLLDQQLTALPTNSYAFPATALKFRMQGIP